MQTRGAFTLDPPVEGVHDITYIGEHSSKEQLAKFALGMAQATEMDNAFDLEFESELCADEQPVGGSADSG